MQYRSMGRSGLHVSALSYGSWINFGTGIDDTLARECLALAYDRGVNFFDTAEVYLGGEAERILGRAFRQLAWARDSFCVCTKVLYGPNDTNEAHKTRPTQKGLSRKHLVEACEQSLKRLQLDYLDFYLCHRPDPAMSIEEIAWTMHTLILQGKILYWGTSEWPAEQVAAAITFSLDNSLIPPQVEQPQYNLFHRERVEQEYREVIEKYGLGITTWSPLASGVLSGKYDEGFPAGSRLNKDGFSWLRGFALENREATMLEAVRRMKSLSDGLGISRAQLAIAWCLVNPNISTVILGASSREQLEHNLEALDIVPKLTGDIRHELETLFA